MKRLNIIILIILLLFLFPNIAESKDYNVKNIKYRLEQANSNGTVSFSVKADVTNLGPSKKLIIKLISVDSDGYELDNVYLSGYIESGKTVTLTHRAFMRKEAFDKIKKWICPDIGLY